MANRNITLSLPEELIRRVKVSAARQDTSVSALVGALIESALGHVDSDTDIWEREAQLMDTGALRIGAAAWARDDIHDRRE